MILVLLGTNDKKFTRLLDAIEKQIKNKKIKDKVIVQAGCTDYKSDNMEIFDLIDKEKLDKLVDEADIIITHAGVGSILGALEKNKKVIAAARLSKYNEHTNDHQLEIVKEFKEKGYIIELSDFDKLDEAINKAKNFKPKKYESNNKKFVKILNDYIKETNNISLYNKYRKYISNGYTNIILSIINIIIFYKLGFNLIINVIISYLITLILSLLSNYIMDISINKKYIITKSFNLIFDIILMILFVNYLNIDILLSKVITNILLSIPRSKNI